MKIGRLLTVVLICFAILPMTASIAIVLAGLDTYAEDILVNQTTRIFNSKAATIQEYFEMNESKAKTMAALDNVVAVATTPNIEDLIIHGNEEAIDEYEQLEEMLIDICDTDEYLAKISLIGENDIILASTNRGSVSGVYTRDNNRRSTVDDRFLDGTTSSTIPFYSEVLNSNGEVVASVALDVKTDLIRGIMRKNMPSDFDNIILIDPTDYILSQVSAYSTHIEDSFEPKRIFAELNKQGDDEISNYEFVTYSYLNKEKIAYIKELEPSGWKLAAYTRARTAKAGLISVKTTIFLSFAMIISISIGIAIVFPIRLLRPMYSIVNTIHSIKRGNYDARVKVKTGNEYGDMARAFNELADQIVVSEGRYRTIVEMSDNIIFEWHFPNDEVFVASTFNQKFSFRSASEKYEDSFLANMDLYYKDRERFKEDVKTIRTTTGLFQSEYRFKSIYGDYTWVLLRTITETDEDGNLYKSVGVIVDIDRAKKREHDLHQMASFDALTGLYNRATFEKTLNNEIELSMIRKSNDAIMFIDIDDFKIFNDEHGHAVGDEVLKFTAKSIRSIVDPYGFVGRYAGDEFVVCIRNTKEGLPDEIARTLQNKLKEGFYCEIIEDVISVNCSIGIAILDEGRKNYEQIIADADEAMYKVKKSGKSRYGYL